MQATVATHHDQLRGRRTSRVGCLRLTGDIEAVEHPERIIRGDPEDASAAAPACGEFGDDPVEKAVATGDQRPRIPVGRIAGEGVGKLRRTGAREGDDEKNDDRTEATT